MIDASPFHGLSAFPLTPADAEGKVDTEALARLVDRLALAGVDSIGLLGSTGNYAYLDRAERHRAVAAAAEAVAGRVPLMVGVGALRSLWSQELAREAEQSGADALLLPPMSYMPLTGDEVAGHYAAVAGNTGLPICIYNNPTTTRFTFSDALIAQLSQTPGIVAVKMPLPANDDFRGEMARIREAAAPGFAIGYSGDWGAARALLAGADAWHSVAAGLLPVPTLRLVRAAKDGEIEKVATLNRAFEPLWALFRAHGSLRIMYVIADQLGLTAGVPPLPIKPLANAVRDDVAVALDHVLQARD